MGIFQFQLSTDPCIHLIGCDFEKDLCSWTQNSTDKLDWNLISGPTPDVGPVVDHTTGDIAGGISSTLIICFVIHCYYYTLLTYSIHVKGANITENN